MNDQARKEAHTYDELVAKTSESLLKLVSKDQAVIDLLRMEQGSKGFMEFLSEEHLTRQEGPITGKELKRMGILGGLRDRTLARRCWPRITSWTRSSRQRSRGRAPRTMPRH